MSLLVETVGRVRVLTINRPERRNALDDTTVAELVTESVEANEDTGVLAVVITGAGDKAFCAGRDMGQINDRARTGRRIAQPMMTAERNHHEAVLEIDKPTIAAVNGPAVGGGMELALACDLRVAADHAYFQLPEATRGMGANFASVLLPALLPRAIAMELLYTGRRMPAEEAARWGLVNRVTPGDGLLDAAMELAEAIASNAPLTLRRYAETARKTWGVPPAAGLRLNAGPNPYRSRDREEGIRAFVEKREPKWEGV